MNRELMDRPPELWDGVVRRLRSAMPAFALDAWVLPLRAEAGSTGLRLHCPSAFHRERVRRRYLGLIVRSAAEEAGRAVPVELAVAEATAEPAPRLELVKEPEPETAAEAPAAPRRTPQQTALPYTFAGFVVGPCNALAREAAFALASARQPGLDRLFLCAGAGLGKTHLARAVALEASQRGERVLYESAETFTNRFLASLRNKHTERFKRRYRQECDLLVVEDVQFLSSKVATQLELFHTLTHLMDAGSRVVLTGDRLPRDVPALDPRLRSQLTSGLVAEIEPPDAAVRRAILRGKAAAGGVGVPDACLDLLVESVRGSVRDLEGALVQLVASASLLKRPIDLALTRAALHKLSPVAGRARKLAIRDVIATVAGFFGTTHAAMAARSRRRDSLMPRQLAMYFCRRYTDEPLAGIARAFDRDHPAVSNAVKVVERRILERAPLRYQVEELASRLDRLREETG